MARTSNESTQRAAAAAVARLSRLTPRAAWAVVAACVAHAAVANVANAAPRSAGPPLIVVVQQRSGVPSAYFSLGAVAGRTTAAGRLIIRNAGGRVVHVRLDPVDAATAGTLGSVYQTPGTAAHGATRWLALGSRFLTIPPHGSRAITVGLHVPRGAAPGDYLSGVSVFAEDQLSSTAARRGLMIGDWYRYAVGVETRLAGRRAPHIGFRGATVVREPSAVVFLLRAHNDGNVILKNVTGQAIISRGQSTVAAASIGPGTFVSHTSIAIPVRAPGEQPTAGAVYRVRARLAYAGGSAQVDTLVTFGHAAAAVQQQYVAPRHAPIRASARTQSMATALIGASAALLLGLLTWLAVLSLRRRRTLLSGPAIRALLARELVAGAANGQVPSLIRVAGAGATVTARRALARRIRPQLRGCDAVGNFGPDDVAIVLPRASDAYAVSVAEQLAAALGHDPTSLTVVTALPGEDAHALMRRARECEADEPSGARVEPAPV